MEDGPGTVDEGKQAYSPSFTPLHCPLVRDLDLPKFGSKTESGRDTGLSSVGPRTSELKERAFWSYDPGSDVPTRIVTRE